ncbi:MAG: hypothetical protein QXE01_11765 [Sulfolobales archaeon]
MPSLKVLIAIIAVIIVAIASTLITMNKPEVSGGGEGLTGSTNVTTALGKGYDQVSSATPRLKPVGLVKGYGYPIGVRDGWFYMLLGSIDGDGGKISLVGVRLGGGDVRDYGVVVDRWNPYSTYVEVAAGRPIIDDRYAYFIQDGGKTARTIDLVSGSISIANVSGTYLWILDAGEGMLYAHDLGSTEKYVVLDLNGRVAWESSGIHVGTMVQPIYISSPEGLMSSPIEGVMVYLYYMLKPMIMRIGVEWYMPGHLF